MHAGKGLPALHVDGVMDSAGAVGQMAAVPAGEGAGNLDILDRVIVGLRSVNVTRAFDPSPPLRQDCDEIFSPSTGAASAGVIASAGVTGSSGSASTAAGIDARWSAPVTPVRQRAPVDRRWHRLTVGIARAGKHRPCRQAGNRTAGTRPMPASKFPSRLSRVTAAALQPSHFACDGSPLSWPCPQQAAKRTAPAAPHSKKPRGHYTARLLIRLPIARFRRFSINRRNRNGCIQNATILEGAAIPASGRGAKGGWPCEQCGR